MKNFKKIFNGFTLVELIIVITILAILATIAFVSFQNYTKDARDSNRLTTISNISKGLDLFSIKTGSFPLPNNISGTGMIGIHALVQVGNIDSSISSLINMHTTPVDPASASKYIYGLSSNGKNYQVASVFENLQSNNILFDTTYASAYKAKVIGNFNGIMRFHSGTTCVANIPSLIFNASGSVDLLGNNIGYVIDKYENLPYNIGKENYQLVKTTSEIVSSISNTGAVTYECGIDAISWETKKAALQTSLGYNVDKIGQSVFGDKYYTEVNNTTSGGGGGAGSPSIPNISFVDFETENNYTVTQSPWNRTNGEKNEGSYSIESGNTALNSSACFEVSTIKSLPFRVMFDFKLSTDSSDNLVYYSNGEVMDYYSGEYPWQTYDSDLSLGTYYTPGSYTFKWCYEKDVSVSAGLDKVWVDNIHIEDATGAVNAVCGDSLGKYYYTQAPTTNLCSMGTPLGMSDGGVLSDYSWDCQGYNGGNLATCSAQHAFGWDYTPPTIKDFFGKRSIYTQNWDRNRYDTTTCNAALMTIQNLSPGTNVIPAVLADNTIYVLAPGKYITSSEIMMGNCSGIIGNGDVNIYSSVYLSDMIKSFDGMEGNIQNSILANIKVHGTSNGASGTHSANSCGATTSTNATIYNSEFEGFYNGICDYNPNPTFNKIKVYNNSRGIEKVSDGAVYTNIMMYNNSNYGLWSDGGSFNTYNNMLAFNNGDGLRIAYEYGSTLNNVVTFNNQYSGYYGTFLQSLINNVYTYNNNKSGLVFDTSMGSIYSLNMNNISTFNNTLTGMIMKGDAPDDIVFYGYTKSFANNPNSVFVNTKLGTGSTLGWSNGTALDTSGTFSQNMIITPNNLGWNFNTKGKQAVTFSGGTTVTYGINLPNQQPPFTTDPNSEANYLFGENTIHYNTSKKIGEW